MEDENPPIATGILDLRALSVTELAALPDNVLGDTLRNLLDRVDDQADQSTSAFTSVI